MAACRQPFILNNMKYIGGRKAATSAVPYSIAAQVSIYSALVLTAMALAPSASAQEAQYNRPSLWMGAAVGANFSYYRGM
jgi:hypothetical protein